jgi:transcriptional/translational regulatory protein YebC/TACO1
LGVEDVIANDDKSIEVVTTPENFITVKEALVKAGFRADQADVTMRPATNVPINDKEIAEKVINLIDTLEDLDDVQSVYSNADIAEKILNELS